jgi:hypothetical protein
MLTVSKVQLLHTGRSAYLRCGLGPAAFHADGAYALPVMTICTDCGRENPPDAQFCAGCGAALAPHDRGAETRKVVTVVFTDLVGSTELGERLDPEAGRRVMIRFFAAMQAMLKGHGGTVEKFIGDAIMAVFGMPTLHEDDALRCAR